MESKSTQTQTQTNKNNKEITLYSKLINDASNEGTYNKKRVIAYATNPIIRYYSKITYLKKSYTFPAEIKELPENTEENIQHKYSQMKDYVEMMKVERLKNDNNPLLQRDKTIYTKKSRAKSN